MSESSPPTSPPQTTNVFVDRPCLKCGYNLRGQTATWNRRALNWQVTCPECGGAQVVALGSAERNLGANPFLTLALVVLVGWIVWQLVAWLAASYASMMQPPAGAYDPFSPDERDLHERPTKLFAADRDSVGCRLALAAFSLHVRAIPIAMSAIGLGLIVSASPYSTQRQRKSLLLIVVAVGCVLGFSLRVSTEGMPIFFDWKWKMASGMVGLIVALAGGKFGLAIGRPLAGDGGEHVCEGEGMMSGTLRVPILSRVAAKKSARRACPTARGRTIISPMTAALSPETLPSHFGPYGGTFVPETLMSALEELEAEYIRAKERSELRRRVSPLPPRLRRPPVDVLFRGTIE